MNIFLQEKGTDHQATFLHNPHKNGVAVRANRTFTERARCMLHDSGIHVKFSEEDIRAAVYLKNRSPSQAVMGKTPFEIWYNRKADLKRLRILCCIEFVHVTKEKRANMIKRQRNVFSYDTAQILSDIE